MVDVRDVAKAHLVAATEPKAKNQRIITVNRCIWMKEMAEFLKEKYPQYKIPSKELPRCGVKLAATFDKKVRLILPLWGVERVFKNDKSKEMLGLTYTEMKDTIQSMAEALDRKSVV